MLNTLLVATSILTAPVQVEVILAGPAVALDGPGKTKLGAAITGVFPGADLAEVKNFNCFVNPEKSELGCDGMYDDRVTDSAFIDLSIAGKVSQTYDTAPEGFVDFRRHAPRKIADTAARPKIETFVEAVFAGVTIDVLYEFRTERHKDDDNVIIARCFYYDIVSEATYVLLVQMKSVVKPIRKIE